VPIEADVVELLTWRVQKTEASGSLAYESEFLENTPTTQRMKSALMRQSK
jgi:hypothetical protein